MSFNCFYNCRVGTITSKSFQELLQTYQMEFDNPADGDLFTVNTATGEVTLQRNLVYIQQQKFQFRGTVRATEDVSTISNSVDVRGCILIILVHYR